LTRFHYARGTRCRSHRYSSEIDVCAVRFTNWLGYVAVLGLGHYHRYNPIRMHLSSTFWCCGEAVTNCGGECIPSTHQCQQVFRLTRRFQSDYLTELGPSVLLETYFVLNL
jgi:hypothetical protein